MRNPHLFSPVQLITLMSCIFFKGETKAEFLKHSINPIPTTQASLSSEYETTSIIEH